MTTAAPVRSPQELYNNWKRSHWAAQDHALIARAQAGHARAA
jgi:hypothetical protein